MHQWVRDAWNAKGIPPFPFSQEMAGTPNPQMDGNGWKWMEMDGNGWKWMEMDGNGWKCMEDHRNRGINFLGLPQYIRAQSLRMGRSDTRSPGIGTRYVSASCCGFNEAPWHHSDWGTKGLNIQKQIQQIQVKCSNATSTYNICRYSRILSQTLVRGLNPPPVEATRAVFAFDLRVQRGESIRSEECLGQKVCEFWVFGTGRTDPVFVEFSSCQRLVACGGHCPSWVLKLAR